MQISKRHIEETLTFIVDGFRDRSLTEDREEFIRSEFSRSSSNIHGIRLLLTCDEAIDDLINRADSILIQYRSDALNRIGISSTCCPTCGGLGTDIATGFLCVNCAGTGNQS